MTRRIVPTVSLLAILGALLAPRSAIAGLHIHLFYNPRLGAPPKAGIIAGGGNIQDIFQVAAESWERVFNDPKDSWDLNVEFGWNPLRNSLYGQEFMTAQGGNPVRITQCLILVNNDPIPDDGVKGYFADPTPRDNSEYRRYSTPDQIVDQKKVNYGRVFSEATGHAVDRIDLLTVATHEIGHVLGLDLGYVGYQARLKDGLWVVPISPPKYKGLEIVIDTNLQHIQDEHQTAIMSQPSQTGRRKLISVVDALVLSRLSLVDRQNLKDPIRVNQDHDHDYDQDDHEHDHSDKGGRGGNGGK